MTFRSAARAACAALLVLSTVTLPCRASDYPLDGVTRRAGLVGPASCRPTQLVHYRGTHIKLEPASPVFEPFADRLQRFEELVVEIGTRVYGRAPVRMVHVGTYVCRSVEAERSHLSEHAFGNAIDVTAFRFPALARGTGRAARLPPALRGPFTLAVRGYRGTRSGRGASDQHRSFFEQLTRALREQDLFRSAIGPVDARHRTHLHLDMAPWTYVRL